MMFPKKQYTKARKARAKERNNKKSSHPESDLQKQVDDYLDVMQIQYIRIPDSVYRWIFANAMVPVWIKSLIGKYLNGVPDNILLFKNGKYLCVELKTESGRLTQGQKRFRDAVGVDNFKICRSLEEVVEIVERKKKEG